MTTLYLAADHAGFLLKEAIKATFATDATYTIVDCGAAAFDRDDDYPDMVMPAAQRVAADVARGVTSVGVVCGGSGQGEAMVANRVTGVRCAVYYGKQHDIITLSREHNHANMLSLGARFLSIEEGVEAVRLWLATPFRMQDRHVRRIAKF